MKRNWRKGQEGKKEKESKRKKRKKLIRVTGKRRERRRTEKEGSERSFDHNRWFIVSSFPNLLIDGIRFCDPVTWLINMIINLSVILYIAQISLFLILLFQASREIEREDSGVMNIEWNERENEDRNRHQKIWDERVSERERVSLREKWGTQRVNDDHLILIYSFEWMIMLWKNSDNKSEKRERVVHSNHNTFTSFFFPLSSSFSSFYSSFLSSFSLFLLLLFQTQRWWTEQEWENEEKWTKEEERGDEERKIERWENQDEKDFFNFLPKERIQEKEEEKWY